MAGKKEKVEESKEQPTEVTLEEAFGDNPSSTDKKVVVEGLLNQALKKETPKPEPQTSTYTREEIDALLLQGKKEYQGLQRVLSRKEQEIQKLKKQVPQSGNQALKAILDELNRPHEEYDAERSTRIARLQAQLEREEQIQRQEVATSQARATLDQKILVAGFDPADEIFDGVNDAFDLAAGIDGNFERAERRLDRILAQASKPKEKEVPKESEEERIERLAEEKLRKRLEEKGELTVETGSPSASSGSLLDFQQRYIKGEVSHEDFETRMRKEGKLL